MRLGELLGLKWGQIDREAGFIRLEAADTKEKKPKSIPINHHVWRVLADLGKVRSIKHDHVFNYRGEPLADIRTGLQVACSGAKIPYGMKAEGGLRFHDIRTTVKTNMLRAGIDKALRDTILGHALQGMDAYYLKPTDQDLKMAMEKYTAWLDGKIPANVLLTTSQNLPPV
jgi:integrase